MPSYDSMKQDIDDSPDNFLRGDIISPHVFEGDESEDCRKDS